MKTITCLLIILLSISGCLSTENKTNTSQEDNEDLVFIADSTFLRQFPIDTTKSVNPLANPKFGRDESIYSFVKDKARYYEIKRFQLTNNINCKILTLDFPGMNLEGEFRILFLATYNENNKEIASVRLAKFEMISDIYALETCQIKNKDVFIKRVFETVDFEETTSEKLKITDKGEIVEIIIP